MKPLKITMSAFGPYSTVATVDFEKDIGSDGVFLVTGDTGAGKTTIFDAISFALYGDPSGGKERRDSKSFRSDYAAAATATFVEFTFSHKGSTYVVKRNPEYPREKKSGSGVTTEKASAEIKCLETGEIIDGPKEVTEKCYELLGLTREQFSQTVMIAQGDFRKILTEKSEERKQLFQKIFKTQIYANLQSRLYAMKKECEEKDDRINGNILNAFSRIIVEPEFPITMEFFGEAKFLDKVMEELSEMTKTESVKYGAFTKTLEGIEKNVDTLNTAIAKGEETNKELKSLETLKKTLSDLSSQKKEMDEKKKKLDESKKVLPILPFVKSVENISSLVTKLEKAITDETEDEAKAKTSLSSLKDALKKAKKEYEAYDELKARVSSLENVLEPLKSKEKIEKDIASEKKALEKALMNSKEADEEYGRIKDAFYMSQYGLIAKELEDKKPCPVCGSTTHPSPAVLPEASATQEELDAADEKRKEFEGILQAETEKNTKLKASLESIEKQISSLKLKKDASAASVKAEIDELNAQALSLKDAYEKAQNNEKKASELLSGISAQLKSNKDSLKEQKEELKAAETELSSSLKEHGFKSLDDLNKANLLEAERNALEREINKFNEDLKSTKDQVKSLEDKTKGLKVIDLEDLKEKLTEAKDAKKAMEKDKSDMNNRLNTNTGILEELEKYKKEKGSMSKNWAIIKELSDLVSGQKSGAVKLSFETYVQQYYFRQVISAANKRLLTLTGGMFTLRCKQTAKNMRTQAGLDLDVYDKSTGHWRDVSTLSGGESFLASLALALGLSDVVQSGSGGIRLDSMFIDEGFGTLDEDTLQKAVSLLVDLADGKRLIGVISHRPELKERIEKQIIIKKKITGSEISIQ